MSKIAELRALADRAQAESGIDMNEAKSGGHARLLPEGYAFGRLVEYIEFGMQPKEFQGKAKDPAMEFSLGFALWGEGYQNEDGTPYILRPYSMSLSQNEKSRAFLLFKSMNWKGTAKSFGQLLGEAFLVKIVHVAKSKTDKTIVSRIDLQGFLPPLDPVTKAPYPIPEAPDDMYRLFLWNQPTKEGWDSLYIEGTYEDGKSKNRLQETCLGATDFQGSPLQLLLAGLGVTIPGKAPSAPAAALPAAPAVVAPAAPAAATVAAPSPVAAPVVPAAAAVAVPVIPAMPVVPSLPAAPVLPA